MTSEQVAHNLRPRKILLNKPVKGMNRKLFQSWRIHYFYCSMTFGLRLSHAKCGDFILYVILYGLWPMIYPCSKHRAHPPWSSSSCRSATQTALTVMRTELTEHAGKATDQRKQGRERNPKNRVRDEPGKAGTESWSNKTKVETTITKTKTNKQKLTRKWELARD